MWFLYVFLGVITALIWGYMFFVFRSFFTVFVPEKRCPKIIISSLLLSAAASLPFLTFFSGDGVYPIVLLHFIVIKLLFKLAITLVKAIFRRHNGAVGVILNRLCIVPIIITAFLLGYGYHNITSLHIATYELPGDLCGIGSVVFVSDIHYGAVADYEYVEDCVKRVEECEPDLFLIGGDIADESTSKEELYELFELLGSVKCRYGSYLVLGNHDLSAYSENPAYSYKEFVTAAEENGITVLEDETVQLSTDLYLVGRRDRSMPRNSIEDLTKGINKNAYTIVIDHQPVEFEAAAEAGADLHISGHTHGGQLFPIGWISTLISPNEQNYGVTRVNGMTAVTSSGLCGWRFPFRTQKHSELVHFIAPLPE